jgi:hypothetical protein
MYARVIWKKKTICDYDVTFRELEPYYSETISPFGDSLDTRGMRREGESSSDGEKMMMTVGGIGCPIRKDSAVVEPEKENLTSIIS